MRVLNCTGRHLTGADKRALRRYWACLQRRVLRDRIRWYGETDGMCTSIAIRMSQEKALVQYEHGKVMTNAVYEGVFGPYIASALIGEGDETRWRTTLPIVKI